MPVDWVVVGLDNGGTMNNGTILDSSGRFLLDQLVEAPSNVREGPDKAMQSLVDSVQQVLELTGVPITSVRAVGLDTPGPASRDGVISSKGATNFGHAGWRGFDIRGALADRLELPVIYNNDGNSAALYAHHVRFGVESGHRGSVAAIVGTGLGGGIVEGGQVIKGAAGMAGELGHDGSSGSVAIGVGYAQRHRAGGRKGAHWPGAWLNRSAMTHSAAGWWPMPKWLA